MKIKTPVMWSELDLHLREFDEVAISNEEFREMLDLFKELYIAVVMLTLGADEDHAENGPCNIYGCKEGLKVIEKVKKWATKV